MYVLGDIGPAFCSQISQKADFPAAARFTDSRKVQPAIVVVIEGCNSPTALPGQIGQRHALQIFSIDVAPQTDSRSTSMRKSEIHPAVLVKVKGYDTDSRRQIFFLEVDGHRARKFSFAWIQIDGGPAFSSRKDKIDGAIVVEVGSHQTRAGSGDTESGLGGYIREGAVAIVTPQNICRNAGLHGQQLIALRVWVRRCTGIAGDVQIEIAIVE